MKGPARLYALPPNVASRRQVIAAPKVKGGVHCIRGTWGLF